MNSALAPWLHDLTLAAFALHIGGGFVGLMSGFIAVFAPKGGKLHRTAGTVFFAAMLVMAAFAFYLSFAMPGQLVNTYISLFTAYLIVTAWLAARRRSRMRWADVVGLLVAVVLLAPFAFISFLVTTGQPLPFRSAVAIEGPVLIAIYVFTTVLVIATTSDARVVFGKPLDGVPRISRHLWRMCLGLGLATGSAFTNGFARLLPGPYHVPAWFFYPQFIPLILLVFWMARVRFKAWLKRTPVAQPA